MAHYEPPHQDLRFLEIRLFSSLVVKELINLLDDVAHLDSILFALLSLNSQYNIIGLYFFF